MNEHREWNDCILHQLDRKCLLKSEHNATVRAYRDAMAELERIGKINDSMCDTIAEMERAELEYKNENRIDGPFSIVDVMKTRRRMGIPEGNRESIYPKIDILLDRIEELESNVAPIRVPFSDAQIEAPERASDEELAELACSIYHTGKPGAEREIPITGTYWPRAIAAVRARVEAPLLAEIAAVRAELTALKVRVAPHDEQRSECWQILNDALLNLCPTMNLAHAVREAIDTLKARVAELEEEVARVRKLASEDSMALDEKLRTLRAELEAVTKMRDEAKKSSELLAVVYQGEMDARKSLQSQLAALRQTIPEHTARELAERLCAEYHGWGGWDDMSHDKQAELVRAVQAVSWPACQPVDADAPLPATETRPVEVGWSVTAEEVAENRGITGGGAADMCQGFMDYLAAHAVLPVPAGVPSVEELAEIGWQASRNYVVHEDAAAAIRNAVLASLPVTTPHEPTDAEVEALARVLHAATNNIYVGGWWAPYEQLEQTGTHGKRGLDAMARAAFAHIGAATPIASAGTLEKLAEIGRQAAEEEHMRQFDAGPIHNGEVEEVKAAIDIAFTTAILRAAKARVGVEPGNVWIDDRPFCFAATDIDYLNSRIVYGVEVPPAATHTGPTRAEAEAKLAELKHSRLIPVAFDEFRDWLLPQLPTERAEMPSAKWLAEKIAIWPHDDTPENTAARCLTALRPWLRAPTSPCKECAKMKLRLEDSQRMEGKRLEVMHRYEQDIKKAHSVLSAALEGE